MNMLEHVEQKGGQSHVTKYGVQTPPTERLFYIRCKRDGSWLSAESATFRLVPNIGNPARVSLMHANTQFGCDEDGSAYQAIDCTKPLHSYVTDWLKQRGQLPFDALYLHVRAYCPFDLRRFEMGAMLNAMVQRGEIDIDAAQHGIEFKIGEHLNDCAVCGSVLESHGDCSNKACTTHAPHWDEHGGYDCHCIRCDLAHAITEGRKALDMGQEHAALLTLVTLLEQNTKIPGLFARELSEKLTAAVMALDEAIQGNGDIVSAAIALNEFLRENCQPHGSEEQQIIRVFLDGGLVQDVTGIVEGQTVRVIDLETEGSHSASVLGMDDMPPWMTDDETPANGPKKSVEACVSNWDTFAGKEEGK